ncbi:MAG TPA: hypothetical protein VKV06_11225, partial [Acidimicrobiales bacterium]|nr:hypothetical protein [Acidimicrobiales bacterium]
MSLLAAATTTTAQCIGPNAREIVLCTAPGSIHEPVNYLSILPVLILGGGALLLLLVSSVLPKRVRPGLYPALTFAVGA